MSFTAEIRVLSGRFPTSSFLTDDVERDAVCILMPPDE
jgi:hypothetical protein